MTYSDNGMFKHRRQCLNADQLPQGAEVSLLRLPMCRLIGTCIRSLLKLRFVTLQKRVKGKAGCKETAGSECRNKSTNMLKMRVPKYYHQYRSGLFVAEAPLLFLLNSWDVTSELNAVRKQRGQVTKLVLPCSKVRKREGEKSSLFCVHRLFSCVPFLTNYDVRKRKQHMDLTISCVLKQNF